MRTLLRWFSRQLAERSLRRRFPRAVIHAGASADISSKVGHNAVLFRDVALSDSVLGAYSYVQAGSRLNCADVGPFCAIAAGVTVGLAAHPMSLVSVSPVFYDDRQPLPEFFVQQPLFQVSMPRTTIGADVWIGQGAMVKAGVHIGVGAVVGAGAVVTKDIAPYAIVAGIPGRELRKRFAPQVVEQLLDSRWWELDSATLKRLAPQFEQPEQFCARIRDQRNSGGDSANG